MSAIKGFLKRASIDVETRETLNDYLEGKMATPKGFVERLCNLAPEAYAALLEDADFKEANKNLIDKLAAIMSSQSRLEGSEIFMEKRYSLFTEIMADIESVTSQNRTFRYNPVSQMELEHALADEVKPLYLFRITNKDLSYAETAAKNLRTSRGRDQLHTMIFKALMSGNQNTYDIGTGKVFYRPASIPVKDTQALAQAMEFFITHPDQIEVMGNASRRYAHHFEIHAVNEQMHQKVMENLHKQ